MTTTTLSPFPTRVQVEVGQLSQLNRLIDEIVPNNAFYTAKLKTCGLEGGVGSLQEFFEKMPFTTKAELIQDQEDHPHYGTNLTYPPEKYVRLCRTSGSTGAPLRCLDTRESWEWMVDNWCRVFSEAGIRPGDRVFFAFSFGPFLGFWTAWDAAAKNGYLCLPGGGVSSYARILAIIENEATVLCCTPTYALRLAEVAREEDVDLSQAKIHTLIVAGEPGGSVPATRARIEKAWGARVFDHHGMTEIGPVSYECPDRAGTLRVIESSYIAEVLDRETHQAVAPGERGELVLTSLGRAALPLLRYRTGDIVELGPKEPDSRGCHDLALIGGIIGRTDDMVPIRGVNVSPSVVENVMHSVSGVADYRAEISEERGLLVMKIKVEPTPDCEDIEHLVGGLQKEFHHTFSLRIPIDVVEPGSLPRFEMKHKRWVRLDKEAS
ncbi:MAG: AMP-binding protein [Candidatus Omnitrophica bacterium]|nr:AMP-binding protein [Candidatus Omnitrophota bacterium]